MKRFSLASVAVIATLASAAVPAPATAGTGPPFYCPKCAHGPGPRGAGVLICRGLDGGTGGADVFTPTGRFAQNCTLP